MRAPRPPRRRHVRKDTIHDPSVRRPGTRSPTTCSRASWTSTADGRRACPAVWSGPRDTAGQGRRRRRRRLRALPRVLRSGRPGLRRRCGGRQRLHLARPPRRPTRSAGRPPETAGLLFSTGNYAGDVMNFTLAQQRLRRRGHRHPGRLRHRRHRQRARRRRSTKRRGIAGDFVVFKVAGAAAEAGYDLDGVERVARHANDRTRTLGVAFAGCTMPGADQPAVRRRPTARWASGWASTASRASPRPPCRAPPSWRARLVDGVLAEAPADDAGTGSG